MPALILLIAAVVAGGGDLLARASRRAHAGPGAGRQAAVQGQQSPPSRGQRQPTPGIRRDWEWWKDDAVKKELGLAEDKADLIDRIYQNRLRQYRPYADEYGRELPVLERMSRERTVTVEEFQIQVSKVEALRSRIQESRLVMFYRISKELSPEQHRKLEEIRDRRRSGRIGGSLR